MPRIHLNLPITPEQSTARGIAADVCQLVVELDAKADVIALVEEFFAPLRQPVRALVVGPFQGQQALQRAAGGTPIRQVVTGELFDLSSGSQLRSALEHIEAEEIALFLCDTSKLEEFISSVTAEEAPWWKLSSATPTSALLSRLDLVDPVACIAASHLSVEFLGSQGAILQVFDRFCRRTV